MSTAVANEILHVPGHLIKNPTNLTAPPDFGGTELGNTAEIVLRVVHRSLELRGEEYASEIVEIIEGSDDIAIACFLRGFDKDALTTIFRNSSISTKTDKPIITWPGATAPSTLGSSKAFKLLFAPDSTEAVPGLILYNAIPLVQEVAEMRFAFDLSDELGVPVIFRAIRNTPGKLAQMALLEDMSLT